MRKKWLIVAGGILVAGVLIVVAVIFVFPRHYVKDYLREIGLKSYLYDDIVNQIGPPIKEEFVDDPSWIRYVLYYEGMTLTFSQTKMSCQFVEITGEQYRLGKKKLGVGSTRKEVEDAYWRIKRIPGPEQNRLTYEEGIIWATYDFDSDDIVTQVILGMG